MSQNRWGNSLGDHLRDAGWQLSATPSEAPVPEGRSPEEWRNYYRSAPVIGRVMVDGENSLAGVYDYLQQWSIVQEKTAAPCIFIARSHDYERCKPASVDAVFETLPNHPYYDSNYVNAPIECEVERAMTRRVRLEGKLVTSFRLVVRELASSPYRLQDERAMVLGHMNMPDTAIQPVPTFTSLAIIRGHGCTPTDLIKNIPLPEVLTFGPLQLLPALEPQA